jgi:hypothetical protein
MAQKDYMVFFFLLLKNGTDIFGPVLFWYCFFWCDWRAGCEEMHSSLSFLIVTLLLLFVHADLHEPKCTFTSPLLLLPPSLPLYYTNSKFEHYFLPSPSFSPLFPSLSLIYCAVQALQKQARGDLLQSHLNQSLFTER